MVITCAYIQHKKKACILLTCPYNASINKVFKHLEFIKYSSSYQGWYIPQNKTLLAQVIAAIKPVATVDITQLQQLVIATSIQPPTEPKPKAIKNESISTYNAHQLAQYVQTLHLKSYSIATIRTYKNEFSIYLQTLKDVPADDLSTQRIKNYLQYCYTTLQLSENTIHSRMNALKFYYEQVLQREKFFLEIPRPKKRLQLPKVISEEKIFKGLINVPNLKHKTLLITAYSAGLRVSEVVKLKIADIDSDRMQIRVEQAKGKKDRMATLAKTTLLTLREYVTKYQPKKYLFEGQISGMPYSVRSAQEVFNIYFNRIKYLVRNFFV